VESLNEAIMNFDLLREFLESDVTQKDFAKRKGISAAAMSTKLSKQMRKLLSTPIIDGKHIVKHTSTVIHDVRHNKVLWIKAINEYDRVIGEPVNYEADNRKISDLTVSEFVRLMAYTNRSY